jgi:hypothetical protein
MQQSPLHVTHNPHSISFSPLPIHSRRAHYKPSPLVSCRTNTYQCRAHPPSSCRHLHKFHQRMRHCRRKPFVSIYRHRAVRRQFLVGGFILAPTPLVKRFTHTSVTTSTPTSCALAERMKSLADLPPPLCRNVLPMSGRSSIIVNVDGRRPTDAHAHRHIVGIDSVFWTGSTTFSHVVHNVVLLVAINESMSDHSLRLKMKAAIHQAVTALTKKQQRV